jgi:hypothetical protein
LPFVTSIHEADPGKRRIEMDRSISLRIGFLENEALSLSEDRGDEIVDEARRRARKITEDAKMVGAWWNQ